jgi:hypothetical protein
MQLMNNWAMPDSSTRHVHVHMLRWHPFVQIQPGVLCLKAWNAKHVMAMFPIPATRSRHVNHWPESTANCLRKNNQRSNDLSRNEERCLVLHQICETSRFRYALLNPGRRACMDKGDFVNALLQHAGIDEENACRQWRLRIWT